MYTTRCYSRFSSPEPFTNAASRRVSSRPRAQNAPEPRAFCSPKSFFRPSPNSVNRSASAGGYSDLSMRAETPTPDDRSDPPCPSASSISQQPRGDCRQSGPWKMPHRATVRRTVATSTSLSPSWSLEKNGTVGLRPLESRRIRRTCGSKDPEEHSVRTLYRLWHDNDNEPYGTPGSPLHAVLSPEYLHSAPPRL